MPTSPSTAVAYENPTLKRRRVTTALVSVLLVVGGTAAFSAAVWPGFALADPLPPPPPPTIVRPAALQLEPAPRVGEQTPLVAALPDVVGVWVQQGINGYLGWQSENAVEAWKISYADGAVSPQLGRSLDSMGLPGSVELPDSVELTVGQWPSTSEANVFFRAQTGSVVDEIASGEVLLASGQVAGQYILGLDKQTGEAVMWWRNGTVVIRAVGPVGLLSDFYSAYPL